MDLKIFIRDVPDFPKEGILFRDIAPLLRAPDALKQAIDQMAAGWQNRLDGVVALDARGFIFGAGLALKLGVPLVMARKKGKLPGVTKSVSYGLEYGEGVLEIHADSFFNEDRVLVVDDLLATGGTAKAACELVEKCGAQVVGCVFVIELQGLNGRNVLSDYYVRSLVTYP